MVKEVRWPSLAQKQLENAYKYILHDSYQNAEKVKKEILSSTRVLTTNPEMYPFDKYRKNNDGSFRLMSCIAIGLLTWLQKKK